MHITDFGLVRQLLVNAFILLSEFPHKSSPSAVMPRRNVLPFLAVLAQAHSRPSQERSSQEIRIRNLVAHDILVLRPDPRAYLAERLLRFRPFHDFLFLLWKERLWCRASKLFVVVRPVRESHLVVGRRDDELAQRRDLVRRGGSEREVKSLCTGGKQGWRVRVCLVEIFDDNYRLGNDGAGRVVPNNRNCVTRTSVWPDASRFGANFFADRFDLGVVHPLSFVWDVLDVKRVSTLHGMSQEELWDGGTPTARSKSKETRHFRAKSKEGRRE